VPAINQVGARTTLQINNQTSAMTNEEFNDSIANMIDKGIDLKKSSDQIAKALIKTIKEQVIKDVKEELRKQYMNVVYENGYPIKAVPQANIEGLEALMR